MARKLRSCCELCSQKQVVPAGDELIAGLPEGLPSQVRVCNLPPPTLACAESDVLERLVRFEALS